MNALPAAINGKPTVISTFAGCGGSSLGYKWAGFKELLAIEWNDNAVETFKANFPDVPVWQRDITKVAPAEILEFCKLRKGELDILDGSPPCQGFSMAGKRCVQDPRNDLFLAFANLIGGLAPKVFVMENVPGMAQGIMRGKFNEILAKLKSLNYTVKCRQMNAMWYGVPQSRRRLVFIGTRKDLDVNPSFPVSLLKKPISVREALKDEKIKATRSQNSGCEVSIGLPKFNDKYSKLWDRLQPGQNAHYLLRKGQNSCVKINPLKPSPTLPKLQTGHGFATICHWAEKRALSITEAKKLCSFPDDFVMIGNYSEQWARLGNAVMPKFMEAIAKHIKKEILEKVYTK